MLVGIEVLVRCLHGRPGMYHLVARTADHRLAFSTWDEGIRLWHTVWRAAPGARAVCVMPDHVHLLVDQDVRAALGVALGGYARWRNRQRDTRGRLWVPVPAPAPVATRHKLQRSVRYIHLNPCRGGLVDDPLAWPLSSHPDRVGLVVRPLCRRAADPEKFHAYVSADPSVCVTGSTLPRSPEDRPSASAVMDAVSMATRTPVDRLRSRGARELPACAMRTLAGASAAEVAELLQCSAGWARKVRSQDTRELRIVQRWAGDPRCVPLSQPVLDGMLARSHYHRRLP